MSRYYHLIPLLGSLHQCRQRPHDLILKIKQRLPQQPLILILILPQLQPQIINLRILLRYLIQQLLLLPHILSQNHLLLPQLLIHPRHRIYLPLRPLQLLQYLLYVLLLNRVLIPQFLDQLLQLEVLLVPLLTLLFEILVVHLHPLQLYYPIKVPQSYTNPHFSPCTGNALCRKFTPQGQKPPSAYPSLASAAHFPPEVAATRSFSHYRRGTTGYSFAESHPQYPEDVEITRFRRQLVHQQLQRLVHRTTHLHCSVVHHYTI